MALTVADSDVLIDALRGREPAATRVVEEVQSGRLATTAVTAFELLSGAREERARSAVEALLATLTILPLDEAASRAAAEVQCRLEAEGVPIGMADYLIAGICLSRSAVLLTRNRRHFERVRGLFLGDLSVRG